MVEKLNDCTDGKTQTPIGHEAAEQNANWNPKRIESRAIGGGILTEEV